MMNRIPKQASKNMYNDFVNMIGCECFVETFFSNSAVIVDDDDDCDDGDDCDDCDGCGDGCSISF